MNETRLATRALRIQQWAEVIRDQSRSGMTIAMYCHERGISRDSYYYWLRNVRKAALEATGLDFVELNGGVSDTASTTSAFDTEAVISVNGTAISINAHTSKALLKTILEVTRDVK